MISDESLKLIAEDDHVQCGDASAMAKELLALRKAREGWKLVPVEPTEAMLMASYMYASVYSAESYRAMLAAAPEPE